MQKLSEQTVRLTQDEIENIKNTIKSFDPEAKIYIFGSRADLTKKGGDIDILVISSKIDSQARRKIKVELFLKLGDRKIDIIVTDNPQKTEFTKIAYSQGVEI